MTDAFHAYGAKLTFDGDDVGEVTDISGPDISVDEIEATHHESPGGFQEFLPGLKDPGTLTFSGNFVSSAIDDLHDHIKNRTEGTALLTLANNSIWSCKGFVKSIGTDTPVEGKEGYSVTIKLTGKPTFSP